MINMKVLRRLGFSGLLFLLIQVHSQAQASLITFAFDAGSGANTASGEFSFDPATTDTNGSSTIGDYTDALASLSGSATLAGFGTFNFGADDGDIIIWDGNPNGANTAYGDRYQVRAGGGDGVSDDLAGWQLLAINLNMILFATTNPPFITSTDLPLTPPTLFDSPFVAFTLREDQTGGQGLVSLAVNSLTQVPEPTPLALLSFGLVGLGFTRRKKKA
jgi:hypothetical protein